MASYQPHHHYQQHQHQYQQGPQYSPALMPAAPVHSYPHQQQYQHQHQQQQPPFPPYGHAGVPAAPVASSPALMSTAVGAAAVPAIGSAPSQQQGSTALTALYASDPELQSLSAAFQSFRNKRYVNGLLAKKNDLSPNGEPFSMRKWTRWYVELVGPSLVFWSLLDPAIADDPAAQSYWAVASDAAAESASVPEPSFTASATQQKPRPVSKENENGEWILAGIDEDGNARQMLDADRIAHLKSVVMPNHINITDSSAVIVGTQKKRQCVFSLNTSGANRFYFQAESDLDMHIWIRGIRLACYEATKLYEAYSSRLLAISQPPLLDRFVEDETMLSAERTRAILSDVMNGRCAGSILARVAGATQWRKFWAVIRTPNTNMSGVQQRGVRFAAPTLSGGAPELQLYLSPEAASDPSCVPVVRLGQAQHVYAIYPEKIELVESATIFKVEGDFIINDNQQQQQQQQRGGSSAAQMALFMAPTANELLYFLASLTAVFELYGRPDQMDCPLPFNASTSDANNGDSNNNINVDDVVYLNLNECSSVSVDGNSLIESKSDLEQVFQQKLRKIAATKKAAAAFAAPGNKKNSSGNAVRGRGNGKFSKYNLDNSDNSDISDEDSDETTTDEDEDDDDEETGSKGTSDSAIAVADKMNGLGLGSKPVVTSDVSDDESSESGSDSEQEVKSSDPVDKLKQRAAAITKKTTANKSSSNKKNKSAEQRTFTPASQSSDEVAPQKYLQHQQQQQQQMLQTNTAANSSSSSSLVNMAGQRQQVPGAVNSGYYSPQTQAARLPVHPNDYEAAAVAAAQPFPQDPYYGAGMQPQMYPEPSVYAGSQYAGSIAGGLAGRQLQQHQQHQQQPYYDDMMYDQGNGAYYGNPQMAAYDAMSIHSGIHGGGMRGSYYGNAANHSQMGQIQRPTLTLLAQQEAQKLFDREQQRQIQSRGIGPSLAHNSANHTNSGGGPLINLQPKVDVGTVSTGLVGAIAAFEQMKNNKKYSNSTSRNVIVPGPPPAPHERDALRQQQLLDDLHSQGLLPHPPPPAFSRINTAGSGFSGSQDSIGLPAPVPGFPLTGSRTNLADMAPGTPRAAAFGHHPMMMTVGGDDEDEDVALVNYARPATPLQLGSAVPMPAGSGSLPQRNSFYGSSTPFTPAGLSRPSSRPSSTINGITGRGGQRVASFTPGTASPLQQPAGSNPANVVNAVMAAAARVAERDSSQRHDASMASTSSSSSSSGPIGSFANANKKDGLRNNAHAGIRRAQTSGIESSSSSSPLSSVQALIPHHSSSSPKMGSVSPPSEPASSSFGRAKTAASAFGAPGGGFAARRPRLPNPLPSDNEDSDDDDSDEDDDDDQSEDEVSDDSDHHQPVKGPKRGKGRH